MRILTQHCWDLAKCHSLSGYFSIEQRQLGNGGSEQDVRRLNADVSDDMAVTVISPKEFVVVD